MPGDALQTLVRLRRFALDEQRKKLQVLLQRENAVRQAIDNVGERIRNEGEKVSAMPELAWSFADFLSTLVRRREQLEARLAEMAPAIEAARAEVTAAFAEVKRVEIARDNRESRAREERRLQEGKFMDELGIARHGRRSGDAGS